MALSAPGVFNVAKGKIAYYGSLPATNDALKAVALEATGLVADATMKDYTTVAAVMAGATNEQTSVARQTLTTVTVTVDQSGDKVDLDCDDWTWAAATGNAIGGIVVFYDPDTTAESDSNNIPISYHPFTVTPDGNDIVVTVAPGGFASAG